MRVFDEEAIEAAVKEPEALASAETAFRALAEDRVELPPPVGLHLPQVEGEVHIKSACVLGSAIFAVKVASGFYRNPERGLPTGSGLILVFDAQTGFPLALLQDGGYLTELRTAAAGALAVRLLTADALETVAVLGTGVQARFQLRALAAVRSWKRMLAWSPDPSHVVQYCQEMERQLGVKCEPAAEADTAVRGADLVITVTPSRTPLIRSDSLAPHATVIAVGADGPDKRELPTAALERAEKIVVDRLSQCRELGELHHALAEGRLRTESVHAELGEILVGRKPGREGDELIICDLTGVGAQDAAIAEVAWAKLSQDS